MTKITDRKKIKATIFLFAMTYLVSYMTRINLGAVIAEVVAQTNMTKTMLSVAVTGSAITYGLGQILSGYIGDRISPKRLVFIGLLTTVCMNLLIPLCQTHVQMTVVWCVNGLAQACMWPPMAKLMVSLFDIPTYSRGSTVVSWGGSFGTIIIYLITPVIIAISGWKMLFLVTAVSGIVMALCWLKFCPNPVFDKPARANVAAEDTKNSKFFTPLLAAIMLAIVLQGMLRDGVTTWMPSFISETFKLSSEISILSGVCLPIFSILCLRLALALYEKLPGNPVRCAAIVFTVGAVSALLLSVVANNSPVGSVACMALLSGSMHGVNLLLICMVPPFFQKQGNISTVSGMLNACTYVGSAISTYGIALLSESAGWYTTAFLWFIIAALGSVICVICSRAWKNKEM